jgi:hypothetical protein
VAAEAPRAAERAPLAVVRDVPIVDSGAVAAAADPAAAEDVAVEDAEEAEKPDDGDTADTGSGSAEAEHASAESSEPENGRTEDTDNENTGTEDDAQAPGSPNPDAVYVETPADEDSAPGTGGFERDESFRAEPAAARAAGSQVQLRLVSSRESVAPDEDEPDAHGTAAGAPWGPAPRRGGEPERPAPTAEFEPVSDAGVDAGEDIWSRLRDRGMPRWIPVVMSAVLAAFGTAVLFVMALRRRYQRHED